MADIEKIKDKIKKLLALSEGTTYENESYVALQKAQALMVEYKLNERDLNPDEIKKCIKKKTAISYGARSSDHYRSKLSEIIADNFCCISYLSRIPGTQTRSICFMGYEEDVAIAEEALKKADHDIYLGYNRVWKKLCQVYNVTSISAKQFEPAKLGYIEGYLAGLKDALESQKEKNQEWGLVLVAPKEAQEFLDGLNFYSSNRINYIDGSFYGEGYEDGAKFNMTKQINNGKE